jgi:hypothetical protein
MINRSANLKDVDSNAGNRKETKRDTIPIQSALDNSVGPGLRDFYNSRVYTIIVFARTKHVSMYVEV